MQSGTLRKARRRANHTITLSQLAQGGVGAGRASVRAQRLPPAGHLPALDTCLCAARPLLQLLQGGNAFDGGDPFELTPTRSTEPQVYLARHTTTECADHAGRLRLRNRHEAKGDRDRLRTLDGDQQILDRKLESEIEGVGACPERRQRCHQ